MKKVEFIMVDNDYDEMKGKYKVSVYEDGKGHKVKFYEMIHIAPAEFYDKRRKLILDDISNGYTVFHEGVTEVPNGKNSLMEVYEMLGGSIGWVMQPKPDYPFVNADVSYSKMNVGEKLFIRSMNFGSGLFKWGLNNLMEDEEKFKSFTDELRRDITNISENPEAIDDSKLPRIFNPLTKWVKKFFLDSRNAIVVNAVLNHDGDAVLVWGKAHHRGVRTLLENYNYSFVGESVVE